MSPSAALQLFLESNVLTGGIVAPWGLDKAVLSLCAARICRMVLAEIVREEVEVNLLRHAAALSPQEAEQILDDYTHLIKLARPTLVPLPDRREVERAGGLVGRQQGGLPHHRAIAGPDVPIAGVPWLTRCRPPTPFLFR